MKKVSVAVVCLMAVLSSMAQTVQRIQPLHLGVSYDKTTNLLFPYVIKSVDRGTKDILTQKAKGVENVLQVKAGKEDFTETNLSVITADGKLYSFLLYYASQPSELNLVLGKGLKDSSLSAIFPDSVNVPAIQTNAAWVREQPSRRLRNKDHRFGMQMRLNGLYIDDGVFYYQLEIVNTTHINYDVELLRFFIKDRKQSKRTASQEVIQEPLLITGNASSVAGNSRQTMVVALPKFTIPDKKELIIQVMEHRGGRHLRLKLANRTIVRARAIPERV